jgi:serine protease Do
MLRATRKPAIWAMQKTRRLGRCPLSYISLLMLVASMHAQPAPDRSGSNPLKQFSDSLQRVIARVVPALVQIEVSGYHRSDDKRSENRLISKGQSQGSGVIFDADGYIVTNAHVVEGAKRIHVLLDEKSSDSLSRWDKKQHIERFDAKLIAKFEEVDLAILKIDAKGLPTLPMANSDKVRQGQVVLAIGSPEGFKNSVSFGLISGVSRQSDADSPVVYLQTDAAINAGSSGGALVDVNGNLVGITTFMMTEGGGSEGLGFALPSRLVHLIYEELRRQGRVPHVGIGATIQGVTPLMAKGLQLPRDRGLIVADLTAGGPAEKAGLQVQDVIFALNDNVVDVLPQFAISLYDKRPGDYVKLGVLRGSRHLTLDIPLVDGSEEDDDPLDAIDTENNLAPKLGIVCASLNHRIRLGTSQTRSSSGVMVVGKMAQGELDTGLVVGDIVHSVNGVAVTGVEVLHSLQERFKSGDAVALQVERRGRLKYLAFEVE